MSETLLVYFSDINDHQPQWMVLKEDDTHSPIKTELDELKFKGKNLPVHIILPAEGFSCFKTDIKTNNRKRLLQAVGYFLQDRILDPTENVFFALDKRKGTAVRIWVCKTALMENWLQHIKDLGLEPERLIPETMLMEPEAEACALWLMEHKIVLHDGLNFAFLHEDNIGKVLDSVVSSQVLDDENENTDPVLISCDVHIFSDSLQPQTEQHENINFKFHDHKGSSGILEALTQQINSNRSFNLLQGEFSKLDYIMEKIKPWRLTLGLLLLLGILQLVSYIPGIYRLQQTVDSLQEEMQQVYLKTFPQENRPADPHASMQQKIKQIKLGNNKAKVYLSKILSDMSQFVVGRGERIKINSVRFFKTKTLVKVEAKDISLIESIPSKINQGKHSIKIVSISEKESGSEGLLEIK